MTIVDLPTLKAIRRLLRASIRHAEIARRFDLAVGTIARIASERRLRRRKLHLLIESDLPEDDQPPDYLAANLRRCPGCGGMVYQWPCLVCRLRAAEEAGIALADGQPPWPSLGAGLPIVGRGSPIVGRGSPDPAQPGLGRPARQSDGGTEGQRAALVVQVLGTQYSVLRIPTSEPPAPNSEPQPLNPQT
jgi:hypothetical protein